MFRDGGSNPGEKKDRKAGPLSLINQKCQREREREQRMVYNSLTQTLCKWQRISVREKERERRKKEKVEGVVGESYPSAVRLYL